MTGLDIFNMFSLKMWIWNIAGSILIAIIIVWFIKKYPDKGLAEAEAFLKEVRKFEE